MKEQILATLVYADIFDYPLTSEEIWRWLITPKQPKNPNRSDFSKVRQQLLAAGKIRRQGNYFYLPGREKITFLRRQREKSARLKWPKARKMALILRVIPWIKLIGVTGALARNNTPADDDIDLFFITQENRLWLTRGLVACLLRLMGVYRRPGQIKDRICPNMFLAEPSLEVAPKDLFIAHEVALMKPLWIKGRTYRQFIHDNRWVNDFLGHWRPPLNGQGTRKKHSVGRSVVSPFFDFAEKISYRWQLQYLTGKKTKEITTPQLIKFHPQDARPRILAEYQKRLRLHKISVL